MKIEVASTAGFCFGVDRAVNTVYQLLEEGKQAATLGPIIHNPQVIGEFESRGVRIVNTPEETPPGYTLVIRSHGVPREVEEKIQALSIPYVDATCPFVKKIHQLAASSGEEGKVFLLAGDKDHPEVRGIVGHCKGENFVIKSIRNWRRNPWHLPLKQRFIRENGKNAWKLLKNYVQMPQFLLQYVMRLRDGRKKQKPLPSAVTG